MTTYPIGTRVVTNNGRWGTVISELDVQGWFDVDEDDEQAAYNAAATKRLRKRQDDFARAAGAAIGRRGY